MVYTFFLYANLYFTLKTMIGFSYITYEASGTWFFGVAMFIAYHAIYSTGGEHYFIYIIWHYHKKVPFFLSPYYEDS
jgi:hypothetical protein